MYQNIKKIDQLNFFLVVISLLIGYSFPIDVLVISYAFLGPAHYLTEISWLNDKKYFTKNQNNFLPFLIISVLCIVIHDIWYISLMFGFFLAITMLFTENWGYRIVFSLFLSAGFIIINHFFPPSYYFFILLPTLVHVLLFTLFFILFGTLKNKSICGVC